MTQSPDWPNQALLERRRQEAIATDPDLASTLAQCDRNKLTVPQTMLHCAEALANAGRNAEAAEAARHAWIAGIGDEPAFLRRWSGAVGADDTWERFQRLAWHDAAAAARQAPRLDPAHRAAAETRLALQRDAPNAEARLAALPTAMRRDPGMMLDHARWLRHADRPADALALWERVGEAAQNDAPADELAGVLDRAQPVGAPPAARWRRRRRVRTDRPARADYSGADVGRGVPGGLHRVASADRSGSGEAAFHYARGAVEGGDHSGPRALLARARHRRRGWRSEAGIPTRRRLADNVLWPARRARVGRRPVGVGATHHRAA